MSITLQKRILWTTGVSLGTMLLLSLSQALVQVSKVIDLSQVLVLLAIVFPLIALTNGIFSRLLAGSIWSALIASTAAFSIVLLVLFHGTALFYTPLYVLLSVMGYGATTWLSRRK